MSFAFPENCKVVQALAPCVGAADVKTGTYISLKNVHRAWIVISYITAGNAETFQPLMATAVAPTGSTNVTANMRIWSNLATATNDRLVERAAGTSYACDAGATNKLIIFEIDPAALGDNGATPPVPYDCISFNTTAIAAGDYVSAVYVLEPRYPSRASTAPTVVTD